jgi:metal-responsive CopG/Arc/MetJ family transcriptional regulator
MKRIPLSLPDALARRLTLVAEDRDVSVAALIREMIEERASELRPKPRSLGIGESKYTDTARTLATDLLPPRTWR